MLPSPAGGKLWCVFDVEGDVGNLGWVGMAIVTQERAEYVTEPQLARPILELYARGGYTFVAHNAEYDVSVGLWPIGIPARVVYRNGIFNHARWQFDPTLPPAEIWDSLGLAGNLGLARLGEAVGLPKLETPQRLRGQDPDRYRWLCEEHGRGECEPCYAIRDAQIVLRYLEQLETFLGNHGVRLHRTTAGNAVALWRTTVGDESIGLRSRAYDRFARGSYVGGRCEAFKLGRVSPVYTADVRSMYPALMRRLQFPDPEYAQLVESPLAGGSWLDYEGVAEVEVDIPASYAPPLPVSVPEHLLFPIGRARGTWTHLELRYAVSRGVHILRCLRTLYSTRTYNPFTLYVDRLVEQRELYAREHDPREQVAKLLLNTLSGRLGLKPVSVVEYMGPVLPGERLSDHYGATHSWIGEQLYVRYNPFWGTPRGREARQEYEIIPDDEAGPHLPMNDCNVLWASMITAAGRIQLHELLCLQRTGLIYCDTDSVHSWNPIEGLGEGLGELADTGVWETGVYIGPKLYRLERADGEKKVRAKGVPAHVAERYLAGEEVSYLEPRHVRTAIKTGAAAGVWSEQHARIRHRAPKRFVCDPEAAQSGYSSSNTKPFSLWPSGENDAP